MTKHKKNCVDKKASLIRNLVDFLCRRDETFPEMVCFAILYLASIAIGVRAWFLL